MLDKGQITTLLVDQDTKALGDYSALLQEMGLFNHMRAEDGPEALSMFNALKPGLILARQDAPVIGGLALLRMVRQEEGIGSESVFIVYGANISAKLVAQVGRAGGNMVIPTPCPPEEFKRRVAEALNPPKDENDEAADTLRNKADVLAESGRYDEAIETSKAILDIDSNAEVFFNMGYIKSVRNQLDEALVCFKRATAINNRHARAYHQIGLICRRMGQDEEARRYLELAADIHMDKQEDAEAEEIFKMVLTLRPDTGNVYNSLGIVYRRQGRLEESARVYAKAVKVHPDDENILFNAARTFLELRNMSMAEEFLRRALALNPDFFEAGELLRSIEAGRNSPPQAAAQE